MPTRCMCTSSRPWRSGSGAIMASHGLTDAAAAEERLREDDIGHNTFVQRFYNRRVG